MAHFQAKIGVFGTLDHQKLMVSLTSSVYILILLIKSFRLSANLTFQKFCPPTF